MSGTAMDVLILGASTRAAASSAVRAGLAPTGIDLFADRDLAAIARAIPIPPGDYPHGLAALADMAPAGPWLYTGALENHPGLVDRIARRRPLWGISGATLRAVRDPVAVAELLRRADLPCPEVRLGPEGLPRDGSWLVKPLASAGGQGVRPLGPGDATPGRPSYYQERIAGTSLAAIFVGSRSGATLAGVTRQWVGRPGSEFSYVGSLGPWPVSPGESRRIQALGDSLARGFGLAGLFGVDLILRDGIPWPVEVNPRYTASVEVLELALGRALLAEHRRACEAGDPDTPERCPDQSHHPRLVVGKVIVFASGRVHVPDFELGPIATRDPFAIPRFGDIPRPGTTLEAGWPVMTLFATGPDPETCRLRLERRRAAWGRILGRASAGGGRVRGS
jgi:uncharacterized protein